MVEKYHVERVAVHLEGKLLNGLTPAKVARPSAGRLNALLRMNVVGFETSLDETEADYSLRGGDSDAVSDFIHAILTQAPGRVVLLRGLPPGFPAKNLEQRLSRSYLLADADRSRMRYWNRRERTWTTTKVAPVIKLETMTSATSEASDQHERDEGADPLNPINPDASAMFLVRLQDALDAQRLYRRFNRIVWRYATASGLRQQARVNRSRRESVGEIPDTKTAASREGMEWMEEEDDDEAGGLESLFQKNDEESERSNKAISRDSEKSSSSFSPTKVAFGSKYYWTRPALRAEEAARDARRYVVEAQVMY